jgi:hypothetical protein
MEKDKFKKFIHKLITIIAFLFLSGCTSGQSSAPVVMQEIITVCSCRTDRYNCADFKTRREARELYECCMKKVGYDVHHLDRDSDGIACE